MVLVVLLASIASVMVASTIAVQEVNAEPRIPQKDSKMQRDAQSKLDGGSAFKQQKKSRDPEPSTTDKNGNIEVPLQLPPGSYDPDGSWPLEPPPCLDPKDCK
jgi:hypothetical protein